MKSSTKSVIYQIEYNGNANGNLPSPICEKQEKLRNEKKDLESQMTQLKIQINTQVNEKEELTNEIDNNNQLITVILINKKIK